MDMNWSSCTILLRCLCYAQSFNAEVTIVVCYSQLQVPVVPVLIL